MVNPEEYFRVKERIEILKEKTAKTKIKFDINDQMFRTILFDSKFDSQIKTDEKLQTKVTDKLKEWLSRKEDYVDELEELNKAKDKYIEILESFVGDPFPQIDIDKK